MIVAQSCLTPCDPMDCIPPDSYVCGIFQARILECVAIPFSRGSSWPRDQTCVSCIAGDSLLPEPLGKPLCIQVMINIPGSPGDKESPASAEDTRNVGLIPGSEKSPGKGNGTPLQYFCLENSMDWGACWATVLGATKSRIWLRKVHTHIFVFVVQLPGHGALQHTRAPCPSPSVVT